MSKNDSSMRAPLSQQLVVTSAIDLADAEGLDAVSMRALAARLGVVPMALYKHVSDKEHLLTCMVDRVVQEYSTPPNETHWQDRVRSRILAARQASLIHPWLRNAIGTRTQRTETVLSHMNAIAGDFIEGGFSPDLTHYAMHALGTYIWGYASEAFDDPDAPTPAAASNPEIVQYMTERYPYVVAIAVDAASRRPNGACEQQSEFHFTLDLFLESFDRLQRASWSSNRS